MGGSRLSLFARVPAAGRTKTRLVPPLSPEGAAVLQRAMTGDLLERLSEGLRPGTARELRHDGARAPDAFEIPPGWTVSPQGPGNLGAKLERTVREAAADEVARLVIAGSDSPLLPLPLVENAFAALADSDAVVVPAEDGGFVLIGVAARRLAAETAARLFRGVPWGTERVLRGTRENAVAAGIGLAVLREHWDVDRPEDLDRLRREVSSLAARDRPRRVAAFLDA